VATVLTILLKINWPNFCRSNVHYVGSKCLGGETSRGRNNDSAKRP